MIAFERFLAQPCPPENGSVLWINTSKKPLTLNMPTVEGWQTLGAFYDAESFTKILAILGEFTVSGRTVASMLEEIRTFCDEECTEAEIRAMFS